MGRTIGFLLAARQPGDLDAERGEPIQQLIMVLLGQQFGGRHQGRLIPSLNGLTGGQRRHNGFTATHIALQQTLHRVALV